MNKTAFVISLVLTTFILMAIGGIVYATHTAEAAATVPATSGTVTEQPSSLTIDPAVLQAWNEREAAYQKLIAEANARLESAQQQQAALQAQLPAAQDATTSVTPEQAAAIASEFLGQTSVYYVELVTIREVDMYQVIFNSGDIVYVSLEGRVVGSASAQYGGGGGGQAAIGGGAGGGEHGGHESGEHEGGDD
jgi:alanyl-tRNA synthetase